MNGLPFTDAIGFGKSPSRCLMRVPKPPARTTAVIFSGETLTANWRGSHVRVNRVPQNREALDEFHNAAIQIPFRFETRCGDARIADDVIAFVRVFADGRFDEHKLRQMFLDDRAEFE